MSTFRFVVRGFGASHRLDDSLMAYLESRFPAGPDRPAVSRSKVRRLVLSGAVRLDGRTECRPGLELRSGACLEVAFDAGLFFQEKDPQDLEFVMDQSRVLYEDQWLMVVDKPAGLPTEPTVVASRQNLHRAVAGFLAARDGVAEPYLGLHHRLDRETSGVILFSRDKASNPGLHQAFLERRVHKTYLALCALPARPEEQRRAEALAGLLAGRPVRVENTLGRISPRSQACRWGEVAAGEPAVTDLELEERLPGGLVVRASPLTGRTHQIRVHCAGLGIPLLGDGLYGGPTSLGGQELPRCMLHAACLRFRHPLSGAELEIRAGLPPEFQACLDRMGKR